MNQKLKLQAWVDGEISPAEAHSLERETAGNAEAKRFVAELRLIKQAMAGNEMPVVVPETRDFYWSKIQRQIEREAAPARATSGRPAFGWSRWLSPIVGLAGLSCIFMLAVKPVSLPTYDEISSTGEGMEAVTFHDQSAGMTVVWLADSSEQEQPQAIESIAPSPEKANAETEME